MFHQEPLPTFLPVNAIVTEYTFVQVINSCIDLYKSCIILFPHDYEQNLLSLFTNLCFLSVIALIKHNQVMNNVLTSPHHPFRSSLLS
jgi:hypothetical protein